MEVSADDKPKRKRSGEDLTWVTDKTIEEVTHKVQSTKFPVEMLYTFPWWALILVVIGIWVGISIALDEVYSGIFDQLMDGVVITLTVSFVAFGFALIIGLILGMIRSLPPRPRRGLIPRILSIIHTFIYNIATLFVEVMRGLPILVALLIFAFVIIPEFKNYMSSVHNVSIEFRSSSVETAIIALAMTYGAFLSETFRAGIQSVGKGQIEASKSLGMTYAQTMRFIVLPQAIRRVLPPLGNDFISMIKSSSLVAILAVRDVTQIAKVYSGSTFKYLETYLTVTVIYLTMTILGSILVKLIENQVKIEER